MVTLRARLRELRRADDRATMVAITLLADAARVFVAAWIVLLHVAEIGVWALFYLWRDAMPDLASALYFSAVTYTTTGYGDLVLAEGWRVLGAVEALTGILMCGWSTGFFFAIVNRLYQDRSR